MVLLASAKKALLREDKSMCAEIDWKNLSSRCTSNAVYVCITIVTFQINAGTDDRWWVFKKLFFFPAIHPRAYLRRVREQHGLDFPEKLTYTSAASSPSPVSLYQLLLRIKYYNNMYSITVGRRARSRIVPWNPNSVEIIN